MGKTPPVSDPLQKAVEEMLAARKPAEPAGSLSPELLQKVSQATQKSIEPPSPEDALSGYLGWARGLTGVYAFRGQANAGWLLESSALRRLQKNREISAGLVEYVFTGYLDDIVHQVRVRFPEHNDLSALEIMALLQHQGGATGLIDFTESPLVALYFACQSTKDSTDGKIFAVPLDDKQIFEVRSKETLGREADHFFPTHPEKLWFWRPGHNDRRILRQQSVFVFGHPSIDKFEGVVSRSIPAATKPALLRWLETMGVSERSLFSDFPGFADSNAWSKEYSAHNAEVYYTGLIDRDPKSPDAYFRRGIFRHAIRKYEDAVEDYSRVIQLRPSHETSYYNRGLAHRALGWHDKAKSDMTKAKRLAEQKGNKEMAKNAATRLAKYGEAK